jgi:hypothetical protein
MYLKTKNFNKHETKKKPQACRAFEAIFLALCCPTDAQRYILSMRVVRRQKIARICTQKLKKSLV